jgi:Sel1 repeat
MRVNGSGILRLVLGAVLLLSFPGAAMAEAPHRLSSLKPSLTSASEDRLRQQVEALQDIRQQLRSSKKRDLETGLRQLHALAQSGCQPAQIYLGQVLGYLGYQEQAFQWFFKASQTGNAIGQYWVAKCAAQGMGCRPRHERLALAGMQLAADQGLDLAQWELGQLYLYGTKVVWESEAEHLETDYAQALGYLEKAAQQGNAEFQQQLGSLYLQTHGMIPQDAERAVYWLQRSAQQGNALAAQSLARVFSQGAEAQVAQNPAEAYRWHLRSAKLKASTLDATFRGRPSDPLEALWASKAWQTLSPDSLKTVEASVEHWQPQTE